MRSHPPAIADYAVIGDCHGAALVDRDASIDWCAIGRFDADPLFCRILDEERGGFLSLQLDGQRSTSRAYIDSTNILQTTLLAAGGRVMVTDFMPVARVAGSSVHDYVHLVASRSIVRIIECGEGQVDLEITFRPTADFARSATLLEPMKRGIRSNGGADLCSDVPFEIDGDRAKATVTLRRGERRALAIGPEAEATLDRAPELLRATKAFWQEWAAYCRYQGPYGSAVLRSALTLKLLTYAPSGGLAAAVTTSLPEEIGGVRNWDYRYCWLRDAAFTLYALASLGYSGEAGRFMDFTQLACRSTYPRVQIMYGLEGEARLDERELPHLAGYRGSRPVRVGNGAYLQDQLDVYGEVVDWAYLQTSLGQRFSKSSRQFFRHLAVQVLSSWQEPDHGIWESRGEPRNFVFGKLVAWAALDRATKMFGRHRLFGEGRDAIRDAILSRGIDEKSGSLKDSFETGGVDAAVLLAPMLGFPLDDLTLAATIEQVRSRLGSGPFLVRYRSDDGLAGKDGAFLACSFWLADALLVLDRADEARSVFEAVVSRANDVGLLSEEIDPASGELLGNFPQALTHLSLINTATNLALHEAHGASALRGSYADRARYTVKATAGFGGFWAAFRKSGKVGRIRTSRASILELEEPRSDKAAR